MKYFTVEKFDNTGLVKTLMVPKDQARWRIYSHNVKASMEDIKYYKELGGHFSITPEDMIRVPQMHTTNILVAKKEDAGCGVVRYETENNGGNVVSFFNSEGVDGIITNEKNIMLLTIGSDCTPVFMLDPVSKSIGIVHSGWRGTVGKITENAIMLMKKNYGTKVSDLLIHFGPAICGNCYEVGIELIDEFKKILECDEIHKVFKPIVDKEEKYLLDVTESIRLSLIRYGVKEENVTRENCCTFHDNIYDSWRRSKDKTKQMLTGIMLV